MNPAARTLEDSTDLGLKGRKALVRETGRIMLSGSFSAPRDLFCDLAGRRSDLVCTRHSGLPHLCTAPPSASCHRCKRGRDWQARRRHFWTLKYFKSGGG
jgi:hypothetical protein